MPLREMTVSQSIRSVISILIITIQVNYVIDEYQWS